MFWQTGVAVKIQQYIIRPYTRLTLQRDGNLVVYAATDPTIPAIWATNTSMRGIPPFMLYLQPDRNLVLYDSRAKPMWASNTKI